MPRTPAVTTVQQSAIQDGGTGFKQYTLICPNTTVFACQVNEDLSANFNIAEFAFDTVTVGAYTDALEGYTVYLSKSNDRSAAYFVGRVRKALTATTFYINQTSVAIADNDYLWVVKDTKAQTKLGRAVSSGQATTTYFKDYDIGFRLIPPTVYGLQTAYVVVMDSDGNADLVLSPSGQANENGATISSWAWSSDTATYQAGSDSSQNVTLRWTTAGHYMPRVTVTDDGSLTGWFSPHVFVVPADYSATLNTGFSGATINCTTGIGWTASVSANIVTNEDELSFIDELLDENFVAIWTPTTGETFTSDIVMCGRFRKETITHDINPVSGKRFATSFDVEGIGGQLQRIIAQRVPMVYDTAPTEFGYIDSLTPYRAIMYYLIEYTTVTSMHSISFDLFDNTYLMERAATNDGNVLGVLEDILYTINGGIEHNGTGEIYMARKAWYQVDADRDALTTIADLSMTDIQVPAGGGQAWSIVDDYALTIAKEVAAGAWFDTTTDKTSLPIKIVTPAVAPSSGTTYVTFNRQIISADAGTTDAVAELGGRVSNDEAARQPQTVIIAPLLDGFSFIQPSVSQWYTWTITTLDNNRGVSYSTTQRWTLVNVSITYMDSGRRMINGTWLLETSDSNYNQLFSLPPTALPYTYPVVPVVPTYDNFPEADSLKKPNPGGGSVDDELPFDEDDVDAVNDDDMPGDGDSVVNAGSFMAVWNATNIWKISGVHTLETPNAEDKTPSAAADFGTIADVKFNRMSNSYGLLALKNDGTDSAVVSDFYLNGAWTDIRQYQGVWSKLRSRGRDKAYIYCEDQGAIDGDLFIDFTDDNDDDWVFEDFTTDLQANSDYTVDASIIVDDPVDAGEFCCGRGSWVATQTIDAIAINKELLAGWVKIEFDAAITVTLVSFEHLVHYSGGTGSLSRRNTVLYYDADDNLLLEDTDISSTVLNDWRLRNFTTSVQGVAYLWIGVYFQRFLATSGRALIKDITVEGEASGVAVAIIHPRNFNRRPKAGPSIQIQVDALATSSGGIDVGLDETYLYAAVDEKLVDNSVDSTFQTDTPGGSRTSPEEALAVRCYGLSANKYLIAPAISVSTETLWKIEGGSDTAITPNDGANDGLIINGLGALFTYDNSESIFCVLADFSGTTKFCYSSDGGSTWTFNTQVSNAASYVTGVKRGGFYYVYIADGTTLWWVEWDGSSTITLIARTMPAAITGVEHP